MSKIASFFGLTEGNERIYRLARILTILLPIVSATITISTTFYMIFVAEALGAGSFIEGMSLIGVLVVIQMLIQTGLDYPTGAIGDWIGQKWIISGAFICFGLMFYLTSFVTTATPFWLLILIYVLAGVANSQLSGAFMAWFDNNYRAAMPGDTDRKQYGVFWGKVGMIFQVVSTFMLIPGSILAAVLGRHWVFQLQGVLCFFIAIIVLKYVQDFPEVREARQERPSMSEYKALLGDGVRFLFSNKYVTYVILGGTLMMSTSLVWGELILFPFYFSFLLTDIAVSSFRTILFFPGIFTSERSGVWARRFEPKNWIPRFRLLQTGGALFYFIISTLMFFFPSATGETALLQLVIPFTDIAIMQIPETSVVPILLAMIVFITTGLFGGMAEILTQRELLDVIPNRIRNSMYSLSPTIATLFALPQIAFFGWLIPNAGFPITLAIVGAVATLGVLSLRKGLSQPKPVASDLDNEVPISQEAVPAEVVAE
jgi:MFS family permease